MFCFLLYRNDVMGNFMMTYFAEIHLLCLGVLLLLAVHIDHTGKALTSQLYSRILMSIAAAGVCYVVLILFVHLGTYGSIALLLLHSGYVLLCALSVFWWVYYMESRRHSPIVYNRTAIWICASPVIVLAALLLVNLKYPLLFIWHNNILVCNRGAYVIAAIAIFYCVGEAIRYLHWLHLGKDIGYQDAYAVPAQLLFVFIPLAAALIQTMLYQVPVFVPIMTLALLQEYLNESESRISADPLTGLNNRLVLMNRMHSLLVHRDIADMVLVIIDVDHFKSINDTYGHAIGDAALCQCADALRTACHGPFRKALISRYGGDEFILLLPMSQFSELEKLKEEIQKEMKHQCEIYQTPYQLQVSIGAARLSDEIHTEKQWIEAADEQMYTEKAAHHQKESRK